MADYITLLGAEEVSRAAHNMQSAAQEMSSAASYMDQAVARQQSVLDDFLIRFEALLSEHREKSNG